jgi:hypothetical protein
MRTGYSSIEEKTNVFFYEDSRGYPRLAAMPPRHVQIVEIAFPGLLDPEVQLSGNVMRHKHRELTGASVGPSVPPGLKDP